MAPVQASATSRRRVLESGLRAEITSAQLFFGALKGLSTGKKDQLVTWEVDETTVRVISVDPSLVSQSCAIFAKDLFSIYEVEGSDPIQFKLSLPVLLHCLGTLGHQMASLVLGMRFNRAEQTLRIKLEGGEVVTRCNIRTVCDSESLEEMHDRAVVFSDNMPFQKSFRAVRQVNGIIIKAEQLKEAFSILQEMPGASSVFLLVSPEKPFFRLRTQGQLLSCSVDFPNGDNLVNVIGDKAKQETKEFPYRLAILQQAGKALQFAEETCIRMNENGVLAIQHRLTDASAKSAFVEFFILADFTEEELRMFEDEEAEMVKEETNSRFRVDSDDSSPVAKRRKKVTKSKTSKANAGRDSRSESEEYEELF